MSFSQLGRLTWRLALFGWSVQTTYYGFIHLKHEMYQSPAYLTVWGFIFHLIISSLLLLNEFLSSKLQLVHFYNATFTFAFTITVMYWVALYPVETMQERMEWKSNLEVHGGTFATLLIDFFVNDIYVTKMKQNNFGLGMMFFGYLPVYLLYAYFDKPAYKIITFKDFESCVYVLISLSLHIIGFVLLFLLSKLKRRVCSRYQEKDRLKYE